MNRILKKIVAELSPIKEIKALILYGSFARGEVTSRSDIDLFILMTKKVAMKSLQNKIIRLESEIGRDIQPTVRTFKELEKIDSGLLQNIFQEGKILYLKEPVDIPASLLLDQKPQIIYTFQISHLGQNKKSKFNNEFYGKVQGKYRYPGLLKAMGGEKLSSGCVFVSRGQKQKIEKFFRKFSVKFKLLKVWK